MPREFYTEKDIEDMFRSGIMSLELRDNVVLTELAYEKARAVGMKLASRGADHPPCAPVRPYLAGGGLQMESAASPTVPAAGAERCGAGIDIKKRIRDAVLARLGAQADTGLLDVIIQRVLVSTGVK